MNLLPADTRIARARLRVGDLGRSLAFYRDLLGLEVTREEGNTVTLRDLLVLEERPGIARRPFRPATTGLYHVALLVPDRRALGRALLGLRQAELPATRYVRSCGE